MATKGSKKNSWTSYSWLAASVAAAAMAVYSWKYSQTVSRVKLHVGRGKFGKVLATCRALQSHYWPAPLAASAHAQTILTVLRQATLFGTYDRQIVGLQDGGCVALDWWRGSRRPQQAPSSTPIVLILHGLTGGSHEGYVKWMARAVDASGWRAVVLNYRGCAGLPLTSPKCYDAVSTGDVRAAIAHIRRNYPSAPLFAVGYSLGAVLLTKYTADADSDLFAPLPPHSNTSATPPIASPNRPRLSSAHLVASPCASVASCPTPASAMGDPFQKLGGGVHTQCVVSPEASKDWQHSYGWSISNGIRPAPKQGWDWKSSSALWPEPLLKAIGSGEARNVQVSRTDAYTSQTITNGQGVITSSRFLHTSGPVPQHEGKGLHSASGGGMATRGSGLAAAVAISSPFELVSASERLHIPWTMPWLYNRILTWRLKLYVRKHSRKISTLEPKVVLKDIYASETLREFDTAGTCQFLGFATCDEYYSHGSSEKHIPNIRTPFLFLSSEDDPFLGDFSASAKHVLDNPSTAIALTRAGGHCAHLTGIMPLAHSWADGVTMDVFQAVHSTLSEHAHFGEESPNFQH